MKKSFYDDVGRLLKAGKGFYDDDTPIDYKGIQLEINGVSDGVFECTAVRIPRPPPKSEWVGLTDEDIDLYAFDIGVTDNKAPAWLVTYARGIEAKLKEKNT
jgi:hypothetical protein